MLGTNVHASGLKGRRRLTRLCQFDSTEQCALLVRFEDEHSPIVAQKVQQIVRFPQSGVPDHGWRGLEAAVKLRLPDFLSLHRVITRQQAGHKKSKLKTSDACLASTVRPLY